MKGQFQSGEELLSQKPALEMVEKPYEMLVNF